MAERSEAGWVAQRIIDHRQDALEISVDFIVPETQYREASAGEVIVAPPPGRLRRPPSPFGGGMQSVGQP